jgi:hypothetical protein
VLDLAASYDAGLTLKPSAATRILKAPLTAGVRARKDRRTPTSIKMVAA